jgi:ligand-binding SRPBCC domain-containing protein
MKRYILERVQVVEQSRPEVFSFFENPENLGKITPPSMGFEILTPGPIRMAAGAVIDYAVRIFGVRRRWTTLISAYDPPREFVDVQLRGPCLFWHHTHRFEDVAGGTRIIDRVEYIVPYGPLGRMMHALIIERRLNRIFDYRAQQIEERIT